MSIPIPCYGTSYAFTENYWYFIAIIIVITSANSQDAFYQFHFILFGLYLNELYCFYFESFYFSD